MVGISIGENESIDKALRRFKKKYERSGVLKEFKKRTFFVKPSVKKRMEKIKAVRRAQRPDIFWFSAPRPGLFYFRWITGSIISDSFPFE